MMHVVMHSAIFVALLCSFSTSVNGNPIVPNDAEAATYLVRFGHVPPPAPGSLMSFDSLTSGIESFQRFAGLTVTGRLDEETLEKMTESRCGNPDVPSTAMARKKRYAAQGRRWRQRELTWRLSQPTSQLTRRQIETEMREAFRWWSDQSSLRFRQVAPNARADIDIRFAPRSHGDGDPFDGPGRTLAHAFFPTVGDAHFDDDERWQLNSNRGGTNLRIVSAHEFGHSLGLGHSDVNGALMAPFYNPTSNGLHPDDIAGIQALYGSSDVDKPDAYTTRRPTTTRRTISTTSRATTTRSTLAPPEGACNGRFDAITQLRNDSTYAFLGNQFWRLTSSGIEEGYPKSIESVWGVSGSIDAALSYNDITDLFQSDRVYRFQNGRYRGSDKVSALYDGIPNNIDAAFQWSGNGRLYFMKGKQYYRYNTFTRQADNGYPRNISVWRGLPQTIDAALQWNGRTYFFSDGLYYRFNDTAVNVAQLQDQPYPRRVDEWWLGCRDQTFRLTADEENEEGGSATVRVSTFLMVVVSAINLFTSSLL